MRCSEAKQSEPKQVKTLENQEQGTNCFHEAEKGALSCRVFCPRQGLAPVWHSHSRCSQLPAAKRGVSHHRYILILSKSARSFYICEGFQFRAYQLTRQCMGYRINKEFSNTQQRRAWSFLTEVELFFCFLFHASIINYFTFSPQCSLLPLQSYVNKFYITS